MGSVSLVLGAFGLTFALLSSSARLPPGADPQSTTLALDLAFLPFSLVGALILYRRPQNRIGWLFSVMGLSFLLAGATYEYAVYGTITRPGALPGRVIAEWLSQWLLYVGLLGAFYLFLLFPDGHLISRRWVPIAALIVLGSLLSSPSAAATYPPSRTWTGWWPFVIKESSSERSR
jgi:uncharacterized membrane protein